MAVRPAPPRAIAGSGDGGDPTSATSIASAASSHTCMSACSLASSSVSRTPTETAAASLSESAQFEHAVEAAHPSTKTSSDAIATLLPSLGGSDSAGDDALSSALLQTTAEVFPDSPAKEEAPSASALAGSTPAETEDVGTAQATQTTPQNAITQSATHQPSTIASTALLPSSLAIVAASSAMSYPVGGTANLLPPTPVGVLANIGAMLGIAVAVLACVVGATVLVAARVQTRSNSKVAFYASAASASAGATLASPLPNEPRQPSNDGGGEAGGVSNDFSEVAMSPPDSAARQPASADKTTSSTANDAAVINRKSSDYCRSSSSSSSSHGQHPGKNIYGAWNRIRTRMHSARSHSGRSASANVLADDGRAATVSDCTGRGCSSALTAVEEMLLSPGITSSIGGGTACKTASDNSGRFDPQMQLYRHQFYQLHLLHLQQHHHQQNNNNNHGATGVAKLAVEVSAYSSENFFAPSFGVVSPATNTYSPSTAVCSEV
ncbi:hypothetical protein HDU83_002536 [Entophlyctis luteolus]|nr:hypothetical protein HDU83_002536 [Entophlyctis luteolus]